MIINNYFQFKQQQQSIFDVIVDMNGDNDEPKKVKKNHHRQQTK